MPKNRRRKQEQNIQTPVPVISPALDEPLLAHDNGDGAMDTVVAPAWANEPVTTVPAVPTLRSLSSLFTLELALYVVIAIVALLLRVVNLDARPLAPGEAQTAAAAWEFLNGKPVGEYTSPFLFTLNWLAFFLFGAFDLTARLLPAALGALLVLLPCLARNVLGKTGAIVAAVLIAFSPSLVFFARTLSGVDLAVGGALAAVVLFRNYRETRSTRSLYTAAVLAGLSLTTDATAFTVLIVGVGYFAVSLLLARNASGATESNPRNPEGNPFQKPLVRAVIFFAAAYIFSATTFLLNRDGLGVAFNLLGEWLNVFASVGNFTSPLNWLLVYELLPLVFGLAALVFVLSLRREQGRTAGLLWLFASVAIFSFLFYTLAGNISSSAVVPVALPLILLAGWFIGNLLERARADVAVSGGWSSIKAGEIPVFVMLMVLVALVYLQVAAFLQQTRFSPALDELYKLFNMNGGEASLVAAAITLTIISLLLLGVLIGLSILLVGVARTTTLLAIAIMVILALGTLRATWLLNFSDADPLRELLAPEQTPLQMRDLVADVEFFSQARQGDPHVIQIAADPELGAQGRWYLRVFPNLTWTDKTDILVPPEALITPSETPPLGNWMRQAYRVRVDWQPSNLEGIALWKWLVFRQGGGETYQTTLLWLPTEQQ